MERNLATSEKRTGLGGGAATFRRLTDTELQAKREKGLCYRCDGKYTFGHRCPNQELQVLIVKEEEEEDQEMGTEERDEEGNEKLGEEEVVELSLNSVVGLTAPKTMKL